MEDLIAHLKELLRGFRSGVAVAEEHLLHALHLAGAPEETAKPLEPVAALTTEQVQALATAEVQVLSTEDVGALSTEQVAALTTEQVGVLG